MTPVLNTTVVPTTTATPITSVIPTTVEPIPSPAINVTFPDAEWKEIGLRALKGERIDNEKLSILGGFMEKRTPETTLRISISWISESREHCSVLRRGVAKSIRIDGTGRCVFYVQMHESAIDVNGALSDAAADVVTPAITKMIMINDGLISVATTDYLLNPPLTPTPTPTPTQRPVESPEKIFELLKVEKVWEAGFLGTGSVVAVFDRDGFATTHPAFEGKILEEVCIGDPGTDSYCSNGKEIEVGSGVALNRPGAAHGTQTAGVVSMLAPDAKYIFMTFSSEDIGSNLAHSLVYKWVADNAKKYDIDIFIMSMGARNLQRSERNLGYERFCSGGTSNDPEVPDPIESFSSMRMKGVIPVVASGNGGYLDLMDRPACLEDAVSVGAVNGLGEIEDYSNVGQDLTFLAPVNLPAPTLPEFESELFNNHPYSGTSAAAPVVAAMMAIGRQIKPDSTVDELVELGRATGKSIDDYLIKDLKLIDFFAFSQALSTEE